MSVTVINKLSTELGLWLELFKSKSRESIIVVGEFFVAGVFCHIAFMT